MANTTNFGWETPDDTDLVKDGALAMRTLGNAIDTSLVDLKGGTTGQVLSKNTNTDMDFTWVTPNDADAIQNSIVDAKGDLISATADNTPARLASSGVNGNVLTVDTSTSTGLKWAAPATGGWTLLSTTTLSGATTTLTVSSGYKKIVLWVTDFFVAAGGAFGTLRINGNATNYTNWYPEITITNNAVAYAGYFTATGDGIQVMPSGLPSSNNDGVIVCEIDAPDETNMMKTYRAISRYTNNGSNNLAYNVTGVWRDSSAITSLVLGAGNSTWSGGTAYLYGVK